METEQNLRSLQDQAATTNATLAKIDEAGEKLQNIGSSVENVGKKFLPVTAAVTGLGTVAVKTAADFDSEMSKVSAFPVRLGMTSTSFVQKPVKWVLRPSSPHQRLLRRWSTWPWPDGRLLTC